MNDKGEWRLVTSESELHWKNPDATLFEAGEEVIAYIERQYNTTGEGVEIRFEGPENEYRILQQCIAQQFKEKNIECYHRRTIIAVAGKIGAGKTTFIEEICKSLDKDSSSVSCTGYEKFAEYEKFTTSSNMVWYEILGIDIGKENILAARHTFNTLANEGLTDFIYCLSTTKIEDMEEEFITYVRSSYPEIKTSILLTMYVDDSNDLYFEQLSNQLDGIKVIPILAKGRKTREGFIEAYGLDEVSRYLFEGT